MIFNMKKGCYKMKFQHTVYILFIFLITSSTFSVAKELINAPIQTLKPIRLMLNWNHQFQYAGFYAAQKLGYYKDIGLSVQINAWDKNNILETIEQDKADIAIPLYSAKDSGRNQIVFKTLQDD